MVTKQHLSIEDFAAFVHRPENVDRTFELMNGEVIEVSPSRSGYSEVAFTIGFAIKTFCKARNLPCHITVGDGTYDIEGHVIAPDVAYKPTQTNVLDYPDPEPPLWAVEVISPTDAAADVRAKQQIYMDARIYYWEVYLKSQRIDVYVPGEHRQAYGIEDTLDGGNLLPAFTLTVKAVFEDVFG